MMKVRLYPRSALSISRGCRQLLIQSKMGGGGLGGMIGGGNSGGLAGLASKCVPFSRLASVRV